ncbi:MAG: amidase [Armatimonadota bacterium]
MATGQEVAFSPISEVATRYRQRAFSPVELTRLLLDRIARLDAQLHAFITVAADQAFEDASLAERRLQQGDSSPLLGIPIVIKDSIATKGIRTTANSRTLEDWVADRDAIAVERLRSAGAVILGKTNLNEFGWSIPSADDLCPPPCNPWNPQYAAVGSSSGSGVAVAAGFATAALGTDAGGSVRLPAGQMGLVGFKATHALVSRTGVLHAGSIGDVGALARTVTDAALLLNVLAAHDPSDPDAEPRTSVDYSRNLDGNIQEIRVGVPWHYIDEVPVEAGVRTAFELALIELERLGATLVRVEIPALAYARTANFVVLNAEHYAAHEALLRTHWARYGRSARLYLAQGAFLSAVDYLRARAAGRLAREAVDAVFRDVDLLAMPTSPVVTAEAARKPDTHRRGINASFTAPFNLTGHPAFSIPCGMSAVGLPIGFQLVGRRYDESTIYRAAHAYEQATEWHTLSPPETVAAGGGE